MYAVFEDGSRQYKVSEGDIVRVDFRDVPEETRIEFNRVLLYQSGEDTRIGQPILEGARIIAEVLEHPTRKLYIQKFRRRKNYRRFRGHRLPFTEVEIRNILLPGQEIPAPAPSATAGPPPSATAGPPPSEIPGLPPSEIPGLPSSETAGLPSSATAAVAATTQPVSPPASPEPPASS